MVLVVSATNRLPEGQARCRLDSENRPRCLFASAAPFAPASLATVATTLGWVDHADWVIVRLRYKNVPRGVQRRVSGAVEFGNGADAVIGAGLAKRFGDHHDSGNSHILAG